MNGPRLGTAAFREIFDNSRLRFHCCTACVPTSRDFGDRLNKGLANECAQLVQGKNLFLAMGRFISDLVCGGWVGKIFFNENAFCVTSIPQSGISSTFAASTVFRGVGISHRLAELNKGFTNSPAQLVRSILLFLWGVNMIKCLSSFGFLLVKDFSINLRLA